MTFLELCNEVLSNLNEPTLDSFDDSNDDDAKWTIAQTKRRVNNAHRFINGLTRAITTNDSVSGTASTWEYDFPTDCQEILAIDYYNGSSYKPLMTITPQELDLNQLENRTGFTSWRTSYDVPTHWFNSRTKGMFGVYKGFKSDVTDGMSLYYVKVMPDMSAADDLPFDSLTMYDAFHDAIVYRATSRMLREDGNDDWRMWRDLMRDEQAELQEMVDFPMGQQNIMRNTK